MKRIAIIAHGLCDGGAERVASILANHFAEEGNQVLFIAVYSPEKEYKLNDDIKYVYINANASNKIIKMLQRSRGVDKEIINFNSDIAISFIINETIISNLKHKVPIIYSLRIDPGNVKEKKLNWLMCKLAYSRAKTIVFQTKEACDFFDGSIRRKGVVIGNPLTRNLPYWNSEEHEKTIITACRLSRQKNLKMLIEGFAGFHKTHPEYRLKIYGKGPLENELKSYADALKISDYVDFPGHSKDIHRIMSESAIFALTSDFEGLSNSMIEALAIGVPAVCTNCPPGGSAEYITDWENGMLVPVGDVDELSFRLSVLAEDKNLCEKISQNAIKIREKLDEDRVTIQWDAIL